MRQFNGGATRNKVDHKLSYKGFLSFKVLRKFAEYMHVHRLQADGTLRDPANWKQGIPEDVYLDSLDRHVFDLNRMYEGEEVFDDDTGDKLTKETLLCAIMFNAQGLLYERLKYVDSIKS